MSRRPHYRPGLGCILGVAFGDTLTRPVRLAQGFTCVRCCGSPRASSPHGLTAPALASHDGSHCVQLPLARGCYQLAPQRTFTSNPVPMPGTPPSFEMLNPRNLRSGGRMRPGGDDSAGERRSETTAAFQATNRHDGAGPEPEQANRNKRIGIPGKAQRTNPETSKRIG